MVSTGSQHVRPWGLIRLDPAAAAAAAWLSCSLLCVWDQQSCGRRCLHSGRMPYQVRWMCNPKP